MKQMYYDVVIVGTGAAGLFTALKLSKEQRILMITKDKLENSDSYLAQGGISTLLNKEDFKTYYEDTLKAGRYENSKESVEIMIQNSNKMIDNLIAYGVEFDKDKEGNLAYTREGGHSRFRILHHQDVTGKEIVTKLLESVKQRENITLKEYTTMLDLIEEEDVCKGIFVQTKAGETCAVLAHDVVLATGGIGGLFKNSTNFPHIAGDSFACAIRHKVELENLQYIQIHPTVLYSKKKGRRFLISESVRGEGAKLLNEEKKQFVDELLPRDIVTDAIHKEMEKYSTDHVYLSFADIDKEEILRHFPNIYEKCLEEGYDATKDLIPVTPAQHYLMGGIKVNTRGETSMKHLYAVGETACNGVHGANRLASNSLLESLVFAEQTALQIVGEQHEKAQNLETAGLVDIKAVDLITWEENNKKLLKNEIRRKDKKFYDKWCDI